MQIPHYLQSHSAPLRCQSLLDWYVLPSFRLCSGIVVLKSFCRADFPVNERSCTLKARSDAEENENLIIPKNLLSFDHGASSRRETVATKRHIIDRVSYRSLCFKEKLTFLATFKVIFWSQYNTTNFLWLPAFQSKIPIILLGKLWLHNAVKLQQEYALCDARNWLRRMQRVAKHPARPRSPSVGPRP